MLVASQVITVFFVALVVTYLMVPVSKKIADVIGAIDYPNNRKVNTHPVPRCGGIALYAGLVAACLAVMIGQRFFSWELLDYYVFQDVDYRLLFLGITAMFAVGLVDDIVQMKALTKLLGQIGASFIIVASGVSIGVVRSLADSSYIDLGWFDYPLTMVYLVVFVNITNLIDGLDGLAAGIMAIVAGSLLYLVAMRGSATLSLTCVAIIAVCLAFLRYNFFPASIFMGDSGALLLGCMVGVVSIAGVVRTQGFVIMLVPLVIAGVPLLDTVSATVRRLRGHAPVGKGDMEHIHHRLLKSGMSQRRTVLILWACSAVLAVIGDTLGMVSGFVRWVILILLAIVIFFIIWKLGLFRPVLRHYYDNKGRHGPRRPHRRH